VTDLAKLFAAIYGAAYLIAIDAIAQHVETAAGLIEAATGRAAMAMN